MMKRFTRNRKVTTINGVVEGLPPNPGRVALIFPSIGGTSYGISFDGDLDATNRFEVNGGGSHLTLTKELIGETIMSGVRVHAGAGFTFGVMETTCECGQDKLLDQMSSDR